MSKLLETRGNGEIFILDLGKNNNLGENELFISVKSTMFLEIKICDS